MNTLNAKASSLFYTDDYEWVKFMSHVAYTGICAFKLTGFKQIHDIDFTSVPGCKKKGDIIGTIRYNDYQINAHMPVNGRIVRLNAEIVTGNFKLLLEEPEKCGWIAEFIPDNKDDRTGLHSFLSYRCISKAIMPINRLH